MTATHTDDADGNERPPNDEQRLTDDDSMVVFEFAVPAEELALADVLAEYSDVVVEYERLVPTNDSPLPYLWTTDGKSPAFRDAVATDPKVERLKKVATFDEGALYHIEWADDGERLLQWMTNIHEDIAVLEAEGHDDEWMLKLRFPSRSMLAEFRTFIDEQGIDLRVVRLYDLTDPKMGQYNISKKQREALVRALEMGHFEIPRDTTLEEVADSMGISQKALSERLRRGQTNLISNTLTVGQPTGVGVGEQ